MKSKIFGIKNPKRIYDGDIIKVKIIISGNYWRSERDELRFIDVRGLFFKKFYQILPGCCIWELTDEGVESCSVVGNIYKDNTDLVKSFIKELKMYNIKIKQIK